MKLIPAIGSAVCLALTLGSTAACNRAPDPSDKVSQALKSANLNDVDVKWDKDAHVAHLTGTVDQPTDRQRAEDVASAAVGTSGRVLNELTIKNVNDKTADDLDGDVRSHLEQEVKDDPLLRDRDIDFAVNNGVVTVTGEVRSAAEKARVTEIVRSAPGVEDMANELEIASRK